MAAEAVNNETANESPKKRYRKVRVGVVTGDKMDKTVVVEIERRTLHKQFRKALRVQKKVKAHDENNDYRVGDRVEIIETRPLSKDKCWRVQKLLDRVTEEGATS